MWYPRGWLFRYMNNTILPPTMAVVSRRILTYLQVKVVEASLVDLDEARGDLLVAS